MTINPFRQDDDLTAMIRDIIAGKRPEAKPVEEGSKEEYQAFFQAALKKFGVDSPADFKSDEEKKKFFDYVDKNYKGEKSEEAEPCPECGKVHEGSCSEEKVEEAKKKDEDVTINVDDEEEDEDEDDDDEEDEKKKKKDEIKVNPDEPKSSDVKEEVKAEKGETFRSILKKIRGE